GAVENPFVLVDEEVQNVDETGSFILGRLSGEHGRHGITPAMDVAIHIQCKLNLMEVRRTVGTVGYFTHLVHGGPQHAYEHGDNRDNDEQLEERKSNTVPLARERSHRDLRKGGGESQLGYFTLNLIRAA